ncbi:hypothetical protein GCM10017750_04620 [Streptomyces racemochromogenes]
MQDGAAAAGPAAVTIPARTRAAVAAAPVRRVRVRVLFIVRFPLWCGRAQRRARSGRLRARGIPWCVICPVRAAR